MATWITPKTDWVKTDSFTYTDYNRIKNNLTYLNDLFNSLAPDKAIEFDFGEDYTYANNYDVDIFNMFEECLQSFTRIGSDVNIGEFKVHRGNSQFLDYDDLNRIEGCCLNWYNVSMGVTGVTVSPSTVKFTVNGQKQQLTANVLPSTAFNKKVIWSSSDTSKVRVSNTGLLTCINGCENGSVVITCTTEDGGYTATCNVTVAIAVTSVTVTPLSVTIGKDATEILTATYLPKNALIHNVSWHASDTSVISLKLPYENNLIANVTGVGSGTGYVTCSLNSEGTYEGWVESNTVPITVEVTSVTSVSVSPTTHSFTEIGDTVQLVATVLPLDAEDRSVTWKSSNTSVATVSSTGLVTCIKAGSATITCTTNDGGYKATCSITATIIKPTSVTLSPSEISVYQGQHFTLTATYSPTNASIEPKFFNFVTSYAEPVNIDWENMTFEFLGKTISTNAKITLSLCGKTSNTVPVTILDPTKLNKCESWGNSVIDKTNYQWITKQRWYPANILPKYRKSGSGSVSITITEVTSTDEYTDYLVVYTFPKPHNNNLLHFYWGNTGVSSSNFIVETAFNPYLNFDV